jgi:hypothetical protein
MGKMSDHDFAGTGKGSFEEADGGVDEKRLFQNASQEGRLGISGGGADGSLVDNFAGNRGNAERSFDSVDGSSGRRFGGDFDLGSFDGFFRPFADEDDIVWRSGARKNAVHSLIQSDCGDEKEDHQSRAPHGLEEAGRVAK